MWPNSQETPGLVTFTEENFNEKHHFLCSISAENILDKALNVPLIKIKNHKYQRKLNNKRDDFGCDPNPMSYRTSFISACVGNYWILGLYLII